MKSPNLLWLKRLALVGISATALSACAVSPDGPAGPGATHGSLGSSSMSDYYYHKDAGWTYVYQNVENIYNADGSTTTLKGANDTVRTLGFDGIASNGDSLFRYEVTYRVSSQYAGRNPFDIYYVGLHGSNGANAAFVADGISIGGMTPMQKRPRPVSTDTILAGIAGLIRTRVDNFANIGPYAWQRDTLWCSSHLDSVFIWEHQNLTGPIVQERCIFTQDFTQNASWVYDVINNPTPTTNCYVVTPNTSMSCGTGSYPYVAGIQIQTTELNDKKFNQELKYFACGIGPIVQYDWWKVTSDGNTATQQDFTRSLISLTHN